MMTPRRRSMGMGTEPAVRLQDTVPLRQTRVGMLLGDLEHRVLAAAWAAKRPATARELFERVVRTHDIVYITCVTVANRLVEKGLLARKRTNDLFQYAPTVTKAEWTARASRHVVQRLVTLGCSAVAASLVDVLAEGDPSQLAELARLVRAKMKEQGV